MAVLTFVDNSKHSISRVQFCFVTQIVLLKVCGPGIHGKFGTHYYTHSTQKKLAKADAALPSRVGDPVVKSPARDGTERVHAASHCLLRGRARGDHFIRHRLIEPRRVHVFRIRRRVRSAQIIHHRGDHRPIFTLALFHALVIIRVMLEIIAHERRVVVIALIVYYTFCLHVDGLSHAAARARYDVRRGSASLSEGVAMPNRP